MNELQPLMKEIQIKYKHDPMTSRGSYKNYIRNTIISLPVVV